jgi:hypothetical protein
MNIKRVVKFSFIIMAAIIFTITLINTILIYQIKENNITKQLIIDLVSMQEKMNELLKDTTTVKSLDELESKKKDFIKYELEFEEIEKKFNLKDSNDFVDLFILDIHKNSVISSKLRQLTQSEKQIEIAFDAIYDLEKDKIDFKNKFDIDYPIENRIRKSLDLEIQKLKDYELYKLFSEVKYYSKEALYQYRNRLTLNKWINSIELFKNNYESSDTLNYLEIVKKIGNYVVLIKEIEDKELNFENKI